MELSEGGWAMSADTGGQSAKRFKRIQMQFRGVAEDHKSQRNWQIRDRKGCQTQGCFQELLKQRISHSSLAATLAARACLDFRINNRRGTQSHSEPCQKGDYEEEESTARLDTLGEMISDKKRSRLPTEPRNFTNV